MTIRKFLTSVADVYGYDMNDNLLFVSKTMLDSNIAVTLGSAPIRGGRGSQLQYIYYHTADMKFTLTDTQWNLAMLGATTGYTPVVGESYYAQETLVMSGSQTSVTGSPLAFTGTTIYGWATYLPTGYTERVTFTGKTFSVTASGSAAGNWCVRYYQANTSAGLAVTIGANIIPNIVKLVMETQLNSSDVTTNAIGIVQIIVPTANLSGDFTINMKSDGVSNTPLTAEALAYTDTTVSGANCTTVGYYAKIIEVINSTSWYSTVIALAVAGGDYHQPLSSARTLDTWAVPSTGAAFRVPPGSVTYSLGTQASASAPGFATGTTIGATTGVVTTGSTSGSGLVTFFVTSASLIDGSVRFYTP